MRIPRTALLAITLFATAAPVAFGGTPASRPATSSAAATRAATSQKEGAMITTREIAYQVGDTRLTGFFAVDGSKSGRRPGVLVVHEWWGHNDYSRQRARMLAELGYAAFALDMYGDGKAAAHPQDAQKFMMEVMGNLEVAERRFNAALKVLLEQPETDPEKIAAIGYCMGGGIVLHMARAGADLDAVASFHGSLGTKTPAQPGDVHARILVAHGAADPFVKPEEIEAFRDEMKAAKVELEFVAYPGVVHGFTNPAATANGEKFNLPLQYDAEADRDSWSKLESLLATTFAK